MVECLVGECGENKTGLGGWWVCVDEKPTAEGCAARVCGGGGGVVETGARGCGVGVPAWVSVGVLLRAWVWRVCACVGAGGCVVSRVACSAG